MVIAGIAALVVAPAARSAAPAQLGWWWAGHLSQLPVSASPPDVPKGGLYVAGGLSGASGVSALRFVLPDGASAPVLTLHVAKSSGTVVFGACRVAGPWKPAEGGAWDTRPKPACDKGAVAGAITAEGGRAVARMPLTSLVDGRVLDVVLVPGKDPATGVDATFDISFEPPGANALAFTSAPQAEANTTAPTTTFTTVASTSASSPSGALGPSAPALAIEPFTPATNISGAPSPSSAEVSTGSLASTAPDPSQSDTNGRIVGAVLGLVVIAVWLLTTRTGLGARLGAISGGATDNMRGIGRFAAPRDSSPPTL